MLVGPRQRIYGALDEVKVTLFPFYLAFYRDMPQQDDNAAIITWLP